MLDFSIAPRLIAGLSVFSDHADRDVFYLLSDTPGLVARDGGALSLLLYRSSERSGGLLGFEAELGISEAQYETVRETLMTDGAGAGVRLLTPDWRDGEVQLAGWLQEDALKPIHRYLGQPNLQGTPRITVAAHLDQQATALARNTVEQDMLPTVVIFQLQTLALAGALDIRVSADLQAVHERLTLEGAFQAPMTRLALEATWEELARDNVIQVEVLDQSGDTEGQRAEALRRVGEDLIARLFSPMPPAEIPPQVGDEAIAAVELSFQLTQRRESLETHARWQFTERQAVALNHYAAASLIGWSQDGAATSIRTVDLSDYRQELVVRCEPDLEALAISAVEVDLALHGQQQSDGGDNPEPEVSDTLLFTEAALEQQMVLRQPPSPGAAYRVRLRFDPDHIQRPGFESDWLPGLNGSVVISPRRLLRPRQLDLLIGRAEMDWLDHVEVVVRDAGGRQYQRLLDGEQRSARLLLPVADEPLSVVSHWRGRGLEPALSSAENELPRDGAGSETVILDSPFGASIRILALPAPGLEFASLSLELHYQADDFEQRLGTDWGMAEQDARELHLRRPSGATTTYRWRMILIGSDGSLEQTEWQESSANTLILGGESDGGEPLQVHRVTTILLGGGVAGRGAFAAEVVLEAGDRQSRKILEGETEQVTITLLAPAGDAPLLTVREFLLKGGSREQQFQTPEAMVVLPPVTVAPPPAPPPAPPLAED